MYSRWINFKNLLKKSVRTHRSESFSSLVRYRHICNTHFRATTLHITDMDCAILIFFCQNVSISKQQKMSSCIEYRYKDTLSTRGTIKLIYQTNVIFLLPKPLTIGFNDWKLRKPTSISQRIRSCLRPLEISSWPLFKQSVTRAGMLKPPPSPLPPT